MNHHASRWVCLGTALLVLIVLATQISPVLNPPKWDEFIVVYDAHRLTAGQVPYRDFFNFIPPGVFLVLAVAFKVVGVSSLTVGRYASSVAMIALFVLTAWALRRRGWGGATSCLWGAVVPVALYGYWAVPSHHWFGALCGAGIVASLGRSDVPKWAEWFSAGILAGLAGTFLQTAGVALLAFCLVLAVTSREGRGRNTGALAVGIAAVWVPFLAVLQWQGATQAFIRDVVLWPARNYSGGGNENAGAALQDLPWRLSDLAATYGADASAARALVAAAGFLLYAALALAFLALLSFGALALFRLLRDRNIRDPWPAASLLALSLMVGLAARGNANWLHLVYLLALLGPLCLASGGPWSDWRPRFRTGAAVLLGALLGAGALYHARGLWFHAPEAWEFSDVDRPIREQAVNRWLRSPGVLTPGDAIAAFPEGGEVYLYSAPAAVGYTYFLPLDREYNSMEDHIAVAEQIGKNRPRWILITPEMELEYLDPASPVGQILRQVYARGGAVGNAIVYLREAKTPLPRPLAKEDGAKKRAPFGAPH
jgi:hypothetical protein